MHRIIIFVLVLVLVFPAVTLHGAERLVGIHAAIAVTQSLPAVAREAGLFKKNNLDFELVFIQRKHLGAAGKLIMDNEELKTGREGSHEIFT